MSVVKEGSMGIFSVFHGKDTPFPPLAEALKPKGDSYVRIDGVDYGIRSWSPSGFVAAPYWDALIAGQIARVRFVLRDFHDQTGELRVDDQILIEEIGESGLKARWWHLPTRKKAQIAATFTLKAAAAG
jgi:hypothetical protein